MHILIGNTVSNNQPHEHDFTALVETHCTEHMQKSLPFVAKDFHILWGAPIKQGARTGVAALVKKGCCWNTKIVSLTNSPCEKYFNIGRLLLVQLFYGKGNRSILIYIVYGQAGSRWEQSKKDELESMIAAITHDMNGRGSVPALIDGDFNIQISIREKQEVLLTEKLQCFCMSWGIFLDSKWCEIPSFFHASNSMIRSCLPGISSALLQESIPGMIWDDYSLRFGDGSCDS